MQYINHYQSPLGNIILTADEDGLTGLRFAGQNHFADGIHGDSEERELPVFAETGKWLDLYFAGKQPDAVPHLHLLGTAFQIEVWNILLTIPYGETITYGGIACRIAARHGIRNMAAQAAGGAVGRNKILLIVPCHRVIGSGGSLTGYAGGIDRKIRLLELENIGGIRRMA